MAKFDKGAGSVAYVIGETRAQAARFLRRHGLSGRAVVADRVEDLPRVRGMEIILLKGYDKRMDYELLFGVNGLFYDFAATIFYQDEIK